MNKISIIGAGAFGFAIANYLSRKGEKISLFDVNKNLIRYLKKEKKHKFHFKSVSLLKNITPTYKFEECIKDSDLIILAVPSSVINRSIINLKNKLGNRPSKVLNLSKGLESKSHRRVSEILKEQIPKAKYAVLSGGMLAEDVICNEKLSATIASEDEDFLKELYNVFNSKFLKIVKSDDVTGVELCGPLKNIVAIFIGLLQGLKLEDKIIKKCLDEFSKEAKEVSMSLGAKEETFSKSSPAWSGDLKVSCFGNSRNRAMGFEISKGKKINEIVKKMKSQNKIVEGYPNSKIFYKIIKRKNLSHKYFKMIYDILYNKKGYKEVICEICK